MKTIEERAHELIAVIFSLPEPGLRDRQTLAPIFMGAMCELVEACAGIADRQAAGFQVLIDHAPTPLRAEDMKRVKNSAEIAAAEIRALIGKAQPLRADLQADSWQLALLREIASARVKRAVVPVYSNALRYGRKIDWGTVHEAIARRWSNYGVEWIRREATKAAKGEEA